MHIDGSALRVVRIKSEPTLEEMIAQITPENMHEEQMTNFVGREVWEWQP